MSSISIDAKSSCILVNHLFDDPHPKHLKLDVDKYKQEKFQYTDDLQTSVDSLFELKPTINFFDILRLISLHELLESSGTALFY